jgi:GNAT superfamily N-acetyltransferase
MSIEIEYLEDFPEALPIVARWAHAERGHQNAGHSIQDVESIFRHRMNKSEPPIAVTAVENSEVLGMASLNIRELEQYPQYEYWLESVFVGEEYRHRGIGKLLVEKVTEIARNLGLREIYLHTGWNEEWYVKFGWQVVDRISTLGHEAVIMRKVVAA